MQHENATRIQCLVSSILINCNPADQSENRDFNNRITATSLTQAEIFAYVGRNYDITVGVGAYLIGIGEVGYGYFYNRRSSVYDIQHYYCLGDNSVYERILTNELERTWTKLVSTAALQSGTVILGAISPGTLKGVTVAFKSPMPNINYDVAATQYLVASASEHVTLYTSDYTVNGFKLSGYNSGTRETGSIKACWIAISSK